MLNLLGKQTLYWWEKNITLLYYFQCFTISITKYGTEIVIFKDIV